MRRVQASFMKRCTSLENGMRKRLALCDHHSHASNQRNRAFSLLFALQKDLLLQFKGTLEIGPSRQSVSFRRLKAMTRRSLKPRRRPAGCIAPVSSAKPAMRARSRTSV